MTAYDSLDAFFADGGEAVAVDLLLADMNGLWRGKQIPVSEASKVGSSVTFPLATGVLTTSGAVSDMIAPTLGAEPDRPCRIVPSGVTAVPWAVRPTVQVQLEMTNENGSDFELNPRAILKRQIEAFKMLGYTPVVGIELEFYLFKAGSLPPELAPTTSGQVPSRGENCYTMDMLHDFESLLYEIEDAAKAQDLPVTSLTVETSHNQFEINMNHRADGLRVADEAMRLKRVVRGVAAKYGMLASFMAKPDIDMGGSGQHVHMSLLNADGKNIYGLPGGDKYLGRSVAGLLDTMEAATALFAPNANSYRRFDPEWYAPIVRAWAHNNRMTSVRTPPGTGSARRFEHRVAGADASPHLVLSAIFAGVLKGLEKELVPPVPLGELEQPAADSPRVPMRWHQALLAFEADLDLRERIGDVFSDVYLKIRGKEEEDAHKYISRREYQDLLRLF